MNREEYQPTPSMVAEQPKPKSFNKKTFILLGILLIFLTGGVMAYKYWWIPKGEIEMSEEISEGELLTINYFRSYQIGFTSQIEIPQEIIQQTILELKKNYPITEIEENESLIKVVSIDLNDDTIKEFIVYPEIIKPYGSVRGASGNGPIYIFQKRNDVWENIAITDINNALAIEKTKTNGYYNLMGYSHLSVCSGIISRYKWNDSTLEYIKQSSSEDTSQCSTEKETTKNETADWHTYRNEEYGYEIRYPANWKVEITQIGTVQARNSTSNSYFEIIENENKEKLSLDEWFEKTTMFDGRPTLKAVAQPIFINGVKAYRINSELKSPNPLFEIVGIANWQNKIFSIYTYSDRTDDNEILNQMLSTFRFLD